MAWDPPRFTGFIRDISDRVRDEAELEHAARSLRQEQDRQAVMMQYLRAANRTAARLASILEPEAIAKTVVEALSGEFEASAAGVWLYDAGRQHLILAAEAGLENGNRPSLGREIEVVMNAYKIGWVARYGKPYVGPINADDLQFEQDWATQNSLTWAGVYPLKSRERLQGVMAVFLGKEIPLGGSDVLATLAAILAGSLDTANLVRNAQGRARSE